MGIIDRITNKIVKRIMEGYQVSLLIEEMKNTPDYFIDEDYYKHYFDREEDDRRRGEGTDSKFDEQVREVH